MTPRQLFNEIEGLIESGATKFDKRTITAQANMWSFMLQSIKKLELGPQGAILSNRKNLKLLRNIEGELNRKINTKGYKQGLKTFLGTFPTIKSAADKYFSDVPGFNPLQQVLTTNLSLSIEATKNSLAQAGISENVIKPIENLLKQNITGGGSFKDMTEALRTTIIGDERIQGKLQSYSGQITKDALNQFNANNTLASANGLNLEFYIYQGAIQSNSREYCKRRIFEGGWFHIKEIEKTASESWSGKIPGTNASNILINRGGFNCNHQYIPVSIDAVPKDIVERARLKGFILST